MTPRQRQWALFNRSGEFWMWTFAALIAARVLGLVETPLGIVLFPLRGPPVAWLAWRVVRILFFLLYLVLLGLLR